MSDVVQEPEKEFMNFEGTIITVMLILILFFSLQAIITSVLEEPQNKDIESRLSAFDCDSNGLVVYSQSTGQVECVPVWVGVNILGERLAQDENALNEVLVNHEERLQNIEELIVKAQQTQGGGQ